MPSTLNPDLNFPGLRESQSVGGAREMVNLGAELCVSLSSLRGNRA